MPGQREHIEEPEREVPRFARATVWPIVIIVAVTQFAASFAGGYWFDEVYMLAIGRGHLDWGTADQPPVAPLLAALADSIAPDSVLALRVPAVLATAAAVLLAALIARELGGDRRTQTITAAAQASTLWITMAGHWLTPYTLEPVEWLLLSWLVLRWIRVRQDGLLLILGVVIGISVETKFQVMLLCLVLLLAVLVFGPRSLLRRPLLWVGAGIAVLLALPTLLWQAFHGWPQLRMSSAVTSEAEELFGGRSGSAISLIMLAGLLSTVLLLYGLVRLLRERSLRDYRFLGVTFLVLYLFFVLVAGRPYYLGGLYGVLSAFGALGLQQRREAGHTRARWLAWPACLLSAALAAGMLVVAHTAQRTADQMGQHAVRQTAAAFHELPGTEQRRTAILGGSYIVAAYLDVYRERFELPPVHSGSRGYGYFAPPPPERDRILFTGKDPSQLRPYCANLRQLRADKGPASVWSCTGLREPWSTLWPKLRSLQV